MNFQGPWCQVWRRYINEVARMELVDTTRVGGVDVTRQRKLIKNGDSIIFEPKDPWNVSFFPVIFDVGMDQYLLIPFLGGWTSIYQGYKVLTHCHVFFWGGVCRCRKRVEKEFKKDAVCVWSLPWILRCLCSLAVVACSHVTLRQFQHCMAKPGRTCLSTRRTT